jgi:hypothetical protein
VTWADAWREALAIAEEAAPEPRGRLHERPATDGQFHVKRLLRGPGPGMGPDREVSGQANKVDPGRGAQALRSARPHLADYGFGPALALGSRARASSNDLDLVVFPHSTDRFNPTADFAMIHAALRYSG